MEKQKIMRQSHPQPSLPLQKHTTSIKTTNIVGVHVDSVIGVVLLEAHGFSHVLVYMVSRQQPVSHDSGVPSTDYQRTTYLEL